MLDTDIENKLLITKGESGRGINEESDLYIYIYTSINKRENLQGPTIIAEVTTLNTLKQTIMEKNLKNNICVNH